MVTRTWTIVAGASVAVMIAASIAGAALERRGPVPDSVRVGVIATAVGAFLVLAVAIPPLALRAFLAGQVAIGNGDVPVVAFLLRHEIVVVRGFWVFMTAGLAIAAPVILRELGFRI